MNKKTFVALLIFLIALVSGFLVCEMFSKNHFEIVEHPEYQFTSEHDYIEYGKQLKAAYQADMYGGSTPEETLELFIDALKAGDTELASKYFMVEKQKAMAEELRVGKENGNLEQAIVYFEKVTQGSPLLGEMYRMISIKGNNEVFLTIDFYKNSFTQKWKISEL